MKSGKLRRLIVVQRFTNGVNEYGTPEMVWTDHARLRAEIETRSAAEFINAQGAGDREAIVFRTRFLEGLTGADSVLFAGDRFNIKEVAEIGHRKGLELRCERLGADT
ncbi:phage head closure protein [Shimia sediminis]|uniref:phage head closure protein n=1 Tax=Shimia sediminis TaxID=2497945 RepID=UPI000F8D8FB6|nr:phage head closure protein [Shimia sediminis]